MDRRLVFNHFEMDPGLTNSGYDIAFDRELLRKFIIDVYCLETNENIFFIFNNYDNIFKSIISDVTNGNKEYKVFKQGLAKNNVFLLSQKEAYKDEQINTNIQYIDDSKDKYIEYNQKIGLSNENIKNTRYFISRFLKNLQNSEMMIQKLDILKINEYLSSFKSINQITLKNYIFILKKFLCYLFENNIIDKKLENQLPNIKKAKNSKLPSVWNFNELNQVINSINRTTNKGKRDYAIIILAITTALRGCDIINLKLNNIDFKNNIITIIQKKTKQEVTIPLMDKTKKALLDYINNARPINTKYQHLFLSCQSIVRPITSTSTLSTILKKYSNKIQLKNNQKRGIHSLRHTTLNYLFNDNETSLTTITEISGHYNADSLNAYIKTDIKRLSEFTLSIKDFGGEQNE